MSFYFIASVTICSDFGAPPPPKEIKSGTVSTVSPSIRHEVMGPDDMIFVFGMLNLSQFFHSLLSPSDQEAV